jgi:hypothetical protein
MIRQNEGFRQMTIAGFRQLPSGFVKGGFDETKPSSCLDRMHVSSRFFLVSSFRQGAGGVGFGRVFGPFTPLIPPPT